MRLIDADAFRNELQEYVFPITGNNLMGAADAYYRTIHLLDNAPTIEAEPVKHGRWFEVKQPDRYGLRVMQECSCCGTRENWLANYCPNCGAKMDGGAEND